MQALAATTDLLKLFGDSTRIRLLSLLQERELSVAELTAVTQLAQSRVSTHLAKLREGGLLADRRLGTSTLHRVNDSAMPGPQRQLWTLLRGQLDDQVLRSDLDRARAVIEARDGGGRWADRVAGEMERHYSPGRTWEATARALPGLMRLGSVLDIGAGDGAIAQEVAPRAERYVCLDRSPRVIAACRRRLSALGHVHHAAADMHHLPFGDGTFDRVMLLNTLTYAEHPQRALCEASRVLRDGGLLSIVTLDAHTHTHITDSYQHLQPGFSPSALQAMLLEAGLAVDRCELTSRERRDPHFQVVTAFAHKGRVAA